VECYFSPSDNTNQKIIYAINSADNDLNVETMLITRSDLARAITDAYQKGVEVQVLTDESQLEKRSDGSLRYENVINILNTSLPIGKFIIDGSVNGILHHKFAIVDANFAASDPQVITGSHNWSNSANDRNDENTLIIHNADIANQYFQQFAYRFKENGGDLYVSAEIIENKNVRIYPNPASHSINIISQEIISRIQLYNISGILCYEEFPVNLNSSEINIQHFQKGLFLLKVETSGAKINTYKIIKR
jgi:phosphatidylserine/phosphatidylglycerophosphate/cardiolipin synthase-like enzyme